VQQTQLSVQQTQLLVQQTQLSVQQTQTQLDVGKIAEATVSLSLPSSLAQLNFFRTGTPRARLVAAFVLLSIHRFFGQPLRYELRTDICPLALSLRKWVIYLSLSLSFSPV
jgi:hypothetical protein